MGKGLTKPRAPAKAVTRIDVLERWIPACTGMSGVSR